MRVRQINLRKLWLSLLLLVSATAIAVPGIQEVMDGNVAKIGSNEYGTLQEAVNAAQQAGGSQTISLIGDVSSETVTINEVANFKLTIDGKKDESSNYTVDARIVVDGLRGNGGSNANGASVTIQNIAFVNNSSADGIQPKHYPHHLTIQDCTYTGSSSSSNKWFINVSDAPLYNATIKNVTVENSRLIQASLGLDVVFENIIATNNCTAGFNIKTEGTVLIKNCQITTAKYAFRDMVDEYVGTITLENNTFISTSTGSDEGAIVNRGGAVGTAHINVESGTYTGPIKVMNNKEGVLAISGGYFSEEFPQEYIAADLVAQGKVCATATDKPGFYTVGEPHYVAQIGENKYVSLQKALDAAHEMTGDVTVELLDNITEVALVHQKAGLNLTIDGDGKTLKGQIYIDGDGRYEGTDALTIKNIKFAYDASTYDEAFVYAPNTKTTGKVYTTGKYNYAHNVTVTDCEFAGEGTTTVAVRVASGAGGNNLTIANNTVVNGHSFAQLTGVKNLTITNNNVTDVKNGINISGGEGTATITGNTLQANATEGYTVRFKDANSSTATLEDNTFGGGEGIVNTATGGTTITINSGYYAGPLPTEEGKVLVNGGYFTVAPALAVCAEGLFPVGSDQEDYPFTVGQAVAEVNGNYYGTLEAAFAAATSGQTVKLLKDVALTERLFVNAGATPAYAGTDNRYATTTEDKSITLDLSGYNVTTSSNIALAGGSLNIVNSGTADATHGVISTSASGLAPIEIRGTGDPSSKRTLTVGENVTLKGAVYGLNIFGTNSDTVANDIEVTVNGTVQGELFVLGNLKNDDNNIIITVNGSVDASEMQSGAEDIKTGIALNGNAKLVVNDGASVKGETGIEVRAGELTVNGGTITGTASEYSYTPNNSGTTIKGAAIAVASYDKTKDVKVTVSDGTLSGGKLIAVVDVQNNLEKVTVKVKDAFVDGAEETVIPQDYKWASNGDGTSTLAPCVYVAQIGDVKYESLADAVAAVSTDGTETTITMIADHAVASGITIAAGKNIVLELNGKVVSYNSPAGNTQALITNRGTLVIQDNTDTALNGTGTGLIGADYTNPDTGEIPGYASNTITNGGTLTVKSGKIVNTATSGAACYVIDNNSTTNNAILNIEGGYIYRNRSQAVRMFCNSTTYQNTLNISGGIVEGGYAGFWTQLPGENASSKKLATINITGGEVKGGSYSWYDYSYGDSFEAVEYNISGGKLTGGIYSYAIKNGVIDGFISGGLFSNPPSSSYIKTPGYMFGPSEEVEGYYTLVPAEVDYSWTENGEVIHDYLPFNTPFKKNYLMDGETITLMQDITLTEDLTWTVETETATSTLTFGEYNITKGDYSVALNPGETIKTDKRTDIFTSANSDYELVETAVSDGYTYSLLKNAIEPVAPEKPAVNPDFSVKIPTGTYQIKNNATGNYVNIVSKYYAKAEGTESTDYTKIGVGVGYKVADGYRVFSLTGKNPADNSEIEAYNYVAKAYTMAVKLVQEKITGRFSDNFSATTIDELNAFADSVCAIYIDDYAYLTLVPVSTDGTNYQVRAMATVPAIPNTVWTLGNSMIRGHVIDGHTCTDTWDWAKWQVYHYINTHSQMDATLQSMVKANLESIVPGTTYFLTAEEDGTLGYATTLSDATLWTMEPVETVEDGLTPDEYHIQNVGTEKFVNVTDTYYAKVDITEDDLIMEEIPATLINVDFGRSSKDNPNLYRITELSNGDKDVVAYVKKAVNKVKSLAANMTLNGTPLYEAMANKINELLGVQIAPADIKEDVELALDLCGEHYAYLNLVDNGDGTVSVYGDMPKVPALLDHAIKKLNLADDFLTWAKAQIDDYFATSGSNATLISLWNGNKGKIVPGQRYYLTSDNDDTFGFANNNSADAAKWMLTHVEKSFAELIDGVDYDVTLAGKTYKKMTYTRSFSSTQKDNYQRWYIPADYTITEEDAGNFEFYKIHMIAASNNEQGDVITDNTKIYLYIEPLSSGTLKANRPYVVKPLKEMTDHVFEMQNVDLLAVDESPRLEVGVSEYLYDFYGTYDHFTYANAHEIFYLNGGSIHPNKKNAKMIPYMWYIKPKKNAINDDYAKVTFEFVEVETPTAITVPEANKSNEIEGYYSVNGIKQDGPQKGLNIVKYKNGQTKKVNIK